MCGGGKTPVSKKTGVLIDARTWRDGKRTAHLCFIHSHQYTSLRFPARDDSISFSGYGELYSLSAVRGIR